MAASTTTTDAPEGEGKPMRMGNGSIWTTPMFNNTPWFPYAGLADQMKDAQSGWASGSGGFINQSNPLYQSIKNAKANVGGGLLGMSAYSGAPNPFMKGFDPYAGRGLNPGGLLAPPASPPGSTPTPPPTSAGGAWSTTPGGPPTVPTVNNPTGVPLINPDTARPATKPGTMAKGAPVVPTGGGLLAPTGVPGMSSAAAPGASSSLPGYKPADVYNPGATGAKTPQIGTQQMVDYFMGLGTDKEKMNYFNAVNQLGPKMGLNYGLGGTLDQALRATMGDSAFKNWLQTNDAKQGSTLGKEGLPSWMLPYFGAK